MARGPEGKIQDNVIRYAREKHDALCVKNEAGRYFVGGFLDYTIYPNITRSPPKDQKVFVVEFKAPGGAMTPRQEHHKKELERRGHKVYVVDSIARGRMIVDQECS